MRKFLSLIGFQLKDKIDTSWAKGSKTMIQRIVFGVFKFLIIAAVSFLLMFFFPRVMIIDKSDIIRLYLVFFVVMMVFALLSATMGLMKSLYFADDNKTLVTMPVTSTQLFFSKIIVYFVFELKRSLEVVVPVTLGFMIPMVIYSQVSFISIIWGWVPLFFTIAFMVLLGSLLSIPTLYISKLFKKYQIAELILFSIIAFGLITGIILLIQLIPEDIDLLSQWGVISSGLTYGLKVFSKYVYPFTQIVRSMFGELDAVDLAYHLQGMSFIKFAILVGSDLILGTIVFFAIKPFYFVMMTKTSEFDKNAIDIEKKNPVHKKYITFVNKEFKLSFRDVEISGSYLSVYVAVPILLLFIDKIYTAIPTSLTGYQMCYAFNILLIILPYLASNSVIATLYSKEGRAAYIKKTKPINPLFPLISKLIFNLAFSIPSIIGACIVFANFAHFEWYLVILLVLSILLIQYAHILYSATLDVMNPQNEGYATNGDDFVNPNERTSTIIGFIASIIIALISFGLFKESYMNYSSYWLAAVKILLISIAAFGSCLLLFVLKVKAYYYEK